MGIVRQIYKFAYNKVLPAISANARAPAAVLAFIMSCPTCTKPHVMRSFFSSLLIWYVFQIRFQFF